MDQRLPTILLRRVVPLGMLICQILACTQASAEPFTYESINITNVIAQNVSGTVTDETGSPLPGVNVIVKGTSAGTTTDSNGKYSLEVSPENILVFSFVGFNSVEIAVGSQTVINVSMTSDIKSLDEVVVTALGISRESASLPYSSQTIKTNELTEVRDANNFINSLQGKVANALITQSSGGVGSDARIVLRGNKSIQGSNSALIVVDGIPNSKGVNINPDDIESMSVMNGAAAAALYGSEAGNGVVLITTKKGKQEDVSISVNSGVTFERPFAMPDFQNTYGQGELGALNMNSGNSWGAKLDGQEYTNTQGFTRKYSAQKDNVKEFFNTGMNVTNSVSVSAGGSKAQAYLSYTNSNVKGIVPENTLKSNNVNLRLSTQMSKRLSADAKITYFSAVVDGMPRAGEGNTAVLDMYQIPRSMSLDDAKIYETTDAMGLPTPSAWPSTLSYRYQNPYWVVNYDKRSEDRSQIFGFLSAKYKITDWLDITGRANIDRTLVSAEQKTNQGTVSWAVNPGGFYATSVNTGSIDWYDVIVHGRNDFKESFNIDYSLGAIYQDKEFKQDDITSDGLNIANKFSHNFGTFPVVVSSGSHIQTQSLFALVNLSYKNSLFLESSIRNDWDSRLAAPHSFMYYSVGASGVISEMVALPDPISFMKLNLSYAEVGNGGQFGLLENTYSYTPGVAHGYIARNSTFSIPDLKPEIIKSKEVGFETKFAQNRYGFQLTFYRSNSINQLLTVSVPQGTGYSSRYINAGNIQNQGMELVLSANPVQKKDFNWSVNFNLAINRNKVIELADGLDVVYQGWFVDWGGLPQIKVGGSYGDLVATKWARDSQGNFMVADNGTPLNNYAIGEQPSLIGNFNPKATMGLTNTFAYKNLSLRLLIDGRVGGVIISGTEANLAYSGITSGTLPYRDGGLVLGGVNTEGEAVTTEISAQDFWQTVSQKRWSTGEFFTYDATSFRVREMSIGYTIPLSGAGTVKSIHLALVGRNLLWLYRGKSVLDIPGIGKRTMWLDPDVSIGSLNSFQGIEYGMSSTRSVGFNVNVTF